MAQRAWRQIRSVGRRYAHTGRKPPWSHSPKQDFGTKTPSLTRRMKGDRRPK
jgi:hypothetical protein